MTVVTVTMDDAIAVLTWDPDEPDRLGLWSVGQFGVYVVPIETMADSMAQKHRPKRQPDETGAP